MTKLLKFKNIIFDFDGVIIDSMKIRDMGFRRIFEKYDSTYIDELIKYNNTNGGLSRFVKIKYFYEQLLNEKINEEKVREYAIKFSEIMRQELIKEKYLIEETVEFIRKWSKEINMHIASGSEEKELNFLCNKLKIEKYFKSINGSPIHKNELVRNIIKDYNYKISETIIIGDSVNDLEAAKENNIYFAGYNNSDLITKSDIYINSFF